ncbi:MAG: hypothetical protein WCJ87_07260 [Burkholderiales bacterium]
MAEMTPARKRIAVLIVVVGSALIGERVVALMGSDAEVVEPSAKSPTRLRAKSRTTASNAAPDGSAIGVQLGRLDARQRSLGDDADVESTTQASLFGAVSWQPPAAKVVAEPPPAPVAPPFPYAYMGGLSEDGVRTTFFTQGDRVLPVKAGDTIDAVYRVEQMNEKHMTLTYLPLNQSMTITFRSGG